MVEISPEVIEASRFFAAENRGVLFDPRLRLHYADARNFLLASRRTWDVIISEPSNPWISGVANLFTGGSGGGGLEVHRVTVWCRRSFARRALFGRLGPGR